MTQWFLFDNIPALTECPGHFTFGQIKHPSLPPHRYFLISEDPVDPVRSSGGSIKLGSKRRLNWPEPPMSESLLQEYVISPPILPILATKQTHSNALPRGYHSVHNTNTNTIRSPQRHEGRSRILVLYNLWYNREEPESILEAKTWGLWCGGA